jgi:glycosyltransferase involved in cell wall biosynthesis
MPDYTKANVTICIINYKTPVFIKLCLRSIRKFTTYPYEVLVIDNNSRDESLDYLKSLKWIRLIERNTEKDPGGGYSHAAALDLGLESCNTEFFISMHSDTFVHKAGWLTELIGRFNSDEKTACVGSGKVELTPKWRNLIKKTTDFRTFKRKLLKEPDPIGKHRYYNRTICCLYRTDVLHREKLSFLADRDKGLTSGKKLYFDLVDRGYRTVELAPSAMSRYIYHLAHATQVVNPAEFKLRGRTIRKCNQLTRKIMSSETIKSILDDEFLDE